jgi:hypothetical protein
MTAFALYGFTCFNVMHQRAVQYSLTVNEDINNCSYFRNNLRRMLFAPA